YESFNSTCAGNTPCVGEEWFVMRLNPAGGLDTSFDQTGIRHYGASLQPTRAQGVAVRSDGRIVVAGNYGGTSIVVFQLLPDGTPDNSFGDGALFAVSPPAGDTAEVSRLQIEADGSIDVAGTYYANQAGFNSNEFFFDRIAADGKSDQPFQYEFGSGPN